MACLLACLGLSTVSRPEIFWVLGKDSVYAPWLWFLVDMSCRDDSAVTPHPQLIPVVTTAH